MKYKIWDKTNNLVTPIHEELTPSQVFERYPAAKLDNFKMVICDANISMGVFMEFDGFKTHCKSLGVTFTDTMTDQEVLDAITAFEENPPEAEATAEERIAAALEFQNLNSLL